MTKTTVWEMPCKSQEFNECPRLRQGSSTLALVYDFEAESGEYASEEVNFLGVVAFKFTASRYCTVEQIRAYDRLETVFDSTWATEVANASDDALHYRIYFDDIGCYEVLAGSFVPPLGT